MGRHAIDTAIITGISNLLTAANTSIPFGATTLASPRTIVRLKILLPTILPTAISRSPRIAAMTEVTTSGSDVPTAIIVNPITNSLTPRYWAKDTALSTSQREPSTNRASPLRTRAMFINQLLFTGPATLASLTYVPFTTLVSLRL